MTTTKVRKSTTRRVAHCGACGTDRGLVSDFNGKDTAGGRRPPVLRISAHGTPRCPGSGLTVTAEQVHWRE